MRTKITTGYENVESNEGQQSWKEREMELLCSYLENKSLYYRFTFL